MMTRWAVIPTACAASPRAACFPVHRQVSRLGFIRMDTFPGPQAQWPHPEGHPSIRQLHGCRDSAEIPSASHGMIAALARICVGCSFVSALYRRRPLLSTVHPA